MLIVLQRRGQQGVTLVEAMVTMAILAIVIMLGMPSLQNWLLNARIRTAAEETLAGLQLARSEAVRRNANVEFVLSATPGWTVQVPGPTVETLQTWAAGEGTAGVMLITTPAAATTLTFDGLGRRLATNSGGDGAVTRVAIDLPSTILIPAETRDLQIDIGLGGQIRLCDPGVSDVSDSRYCL